MTINYPQLALLRFVLEEVKEGRVPSVSNDQKVDLDYLHNNFDNVISRIEKEMKRRPNHTEFSFVMRVSK